ncbi:MAG TPA: DHA2 family efflux MFS transporter permease subunit [Chlamydiales bacterium]|nr:DHA2 family efflux MFS transporter permease subunit [Chlamydiales bacterium]
MNTAPLPFTSVQRCLFLFFVSLVTFLIVLDYSIANIAIPYIAGGLSVSVEEGIYVITFFSIGNAIGLALTGWLVRRVGQVRLVLFSIALFTFFSWICGLAPNILILSSARFIQGLVAGPMLPLSQALLIKEAKPEHRARDLSIWSMTVITGPVLGPLFGGYIAYWYHWSWIFYINIPIGIGCFIVLWWLLRDRETEIETIKSDIFGIFLIVIAVTCFQIFLDKGQQWDWWNSSSIRAAFLTCIVMTVFFIIRELETPYPFFQIRLLKIFSFSFAILLLFVTYGIYFGSIVIIPLWLQEFMGYDAIKAGIAVAPLGIGPILLTLATPLLIKKIGNLLTLALSFLAFALSAFYTSSFLTSVDIEHIGFSRFLMGLGFICYITPLIQISIQHILPQDLSSAVGIFHFFRALSGAVGASVFTTMWERRSIFHHERVGSALTLFNPFTPQPQDSAVLQSLNKALDQQASMLAINDIFYLMGWLYVASLAFLMGYFIWGKLRIIYPK